MNFKKTALLGLTLTCLLLALTGCGAKKEAASDGPFTDMKTVDLDGNEVDSTLFADNTLTLVNVWNLGCTPCIQEIPHLDDLNDDLADRGVAVVGLYYNFGQELSDEDRAAIQALYEENGADYTQLLISEDMMKSSKLANIQAFPTTFFVDSEGKIVDSVMGSNDYEGWKSVIEKTLEKLEG